MNASCNVLIDISGYSHLSEELSQGSKGSRRNKATERCVCRAWHAQLRACRSPLHRLKHMLEWEPASFYMFHMETPRADKMPRGEKATKQLLPARRPADSLPNGHCRKL